MIAFLCGRYCDQNVILIYSFFTHLLFHYEAILQNEETGKSNGKWSNKKTSVKDPKFDLIFFPFFRRIFLRKKILSICNGFVMCCFGLLLMPSAIDSRPFKEVF